MKNKILVYCTLLIVISLFIYIFCEFDKASHVEETCLHTNFTKAFNFEEKLKLDTIYNFSEILKCENWDEVVIVGGSKVNRSIIYVLEGVALPAIKFPNKPKHELIFYFLKNKKLISSPLAFYQFGFIYSKDFNSFNYIRLKKERAVFKCVVLETLGFEEPIYTFKIVP